MRRRRRGPGDALGGPHDVEQGVGLGVLDHVGVVAGRADALVGRRRPRPSPGPASSAGPAAGRRRWGWRSRRRRSRPRPAPGERHDRPRFGTGPRRLGHQQRPGHVVRPPGGGGRAVADGGRGRWWRCRSSSSPWTTSPGRAGSAPRRPVELGRRRCARGCGGEQCGHRRERGDRPETSRPHPSPHLCWRRPPTTNAVTLQLSTIAPENSRTF